MNNNMKNDVKIFVFCVVFLLSSYGIWKFEGDLYRISFGFMIMSLWFGSWIFYYNIHKSLINWQLEPVKHGSFLYKVREWRLKRKNEGKRFY